MASHGPSTFGSSRANSSSESPQARASGRPRTTASASSSRLNDGRAGLALVSVGAPAFGALLVGFYQGKRLKFAGRVGTGFSDKLLRSLFADFSRIAVEKCPFYNLPATGRSRWDQGLTAADMKRCRWVKPKMVCQVKFTEWTRDDRLRQPVFLGIREDKSASEIVRE